MVVEGLAGNVALGSQILDGQFCHVPVKDQRFRSVGKNLFHIGFRVLFCVLFRTGTWGRFFRCFWGCFCVWSHGQSLLPAAFVLIFLQYTTRAASFC